MFTRNIGQVLVIVIALTAICTGANAEKTVYKWVDEDGHVHFSDAPPTDANSVETETLTISKSPPYEAPAQPVAMPPTLTAADDKNQEGQPDKETPLLYEKIDVAHMSIADLDLRCEEAREKMIAPLREVAIEECKQDKREDPAFCERFNADFGEGGQTVSGAIRPRMFDDLPQCVEAREELHRRGR